MYVRSFVPVVGLTFIPLALSAYIPAREVFRRDDLVIGDHLPAHWNYTGCYSDSTSNRVLPLDQYYDDSHMSEEVCIEYCDSKGYSVAGVEYSRECYCGYVLGSTATRQNESDCNMACSGNSAERCGGTSRINVFANDQPAPQTNPGTNQFTSLGCYTDSVSARTLNTSVATNGGPDGLTVSNCVVACSSAGFIYAGVEYGKECYCGNAIQNGGAPASSGCNMICAGNRTEYCGGSARMNLYQSGAAKQQLYNPGFESSGSSWSIGPPPNGASSLSASFQSDSTHAHSGKGYFFAGGSTTSGSSSPRGVCVTTYPYIDKPGSYVLSFYVGGVNEFMPDPRSNSPPQYSLTFSATLAGNSYTGAVCEGSCPINNVGGSPAYAYNTYTLNIPSGYQTLTICANINGIRRGTEDLFYLDDVSLLGPY